MRVEIPRWELHPGQRRLQQSPARFRTAMFGRRWGKNVEAGDEAIAVSLAGKAVGWFEPTYKSLLEVWRDLCQTLRPVARHISDQDKRIELVNGGLIEAWTCDTPDPARGRAYDLVIVNEAGVIRGLLAIWQAAIRPTLTDRQGRALFLGTPQGASHDFSVMHRDAADKPGWARFTGPTGENPHIDPGEIAAAKLELPPEVFAQEFEGIPSEDGGNPFGLDHIRACTVTGDAAEALKKGQPVAFGWDFARSQDWTVGIGLDAEYHTCRIHRWQGVPWGEQKARIREANQAVPAWGDATRSRVDDVIVQDLQRLGTPIIGVPFNASTRQALMQRLQVCLHQEKLRVPDGPIVRELESFRYGYTARGVRYEAPEGMHDDCVMALALAVYGRDQIGVMPEKVDPQVFDENKHPGFEWQEKRRRRPWLDRHDDSQKHWTPEDDLVPLNW